MTESSKPNVQSVCEKTGQTAPPMPVIAPGTTVSFIEWTLLASLNI